MGQRHISFPALESDEFARIVESASLHLFGRAADDLAIIKAGDLTCVGRATIDLNDGAPTVCIVKTCLGPLGREADFYKTINPHPLLPRCYGVERLSAKLAIVFMEFVEGQLLRDHPAIAVRRRAAAEILRLQRDLARCAALRDVIPHAPSFPTGWSGKANDLLDQASSLTSKTMYRPILEDALSLTASTLDDFPIVPVHADLFGDNVLLGVDGRLVFIDWGFVRYGIGLLDVVSLVEDNALKNGSDHLAEDLRLDVVAGALQEAGSGAILRPTAVKLVQAANLLADIDFLEWLLFRVRETRWTYGTAAETIGRQIERIERRCCDLIDVTRSNDLMI
jgi:thiamine kinase-like enzyme